MRDLLLHLHAFRAEECRHHLPAADAHHPGPQLGRNAEAYIDDIVVKSKEAKTLIGDLEETFANLRKVNLCLNPEKCVFGVPSSKLLGFLVSHRGIEANLEKVKAIERMKPPQP